MKPRERKLVIGLVVVAGAVLLLQVVPGLLGAFNLADQIKQRKDELADLEDEQAQFGADLDKYKAYVERTGDMSANAVKSELDTRINALIAESELQDTRIAPKRTEDGETNTKVWTVGTIAFTVTAEGSWEQVMQFVAQVYELPHVAQFTRLKLTPLRAGRKTVDNVKVDADIEVAVLPEVKVARIRRPDRPPDDVRVKYTLADFTELSFNPFLEPPPQVAAIDEPPDPEDHAVEGPVWTGDPARTEKYIPMAWTYGQGEVLVAHRPSSTREVVRVGGQLDGGEVVLVHPLGAVVRRPNGEEFVYALGETLSDAVKLETADAYPEIQVAMERFQAQREELVGPPNVLLEEMPGPDLTTNGQADDMDTNGALQDGEPDIVDNENTDMQTAEKAVEAAGPSATAPPPPARKADPPDGPASGPVPDRQREPRGVTKPSSRTAVRKDR
ncbi:MAG: hypothetical protein JSV19_07420 [Phycisphaerales bacterium]|nr:MAG: hypothetical protein JSV19_07420 [Phycisphaerales bacterium]